MKTPNFEALKLLNWSIVILLFAVSLSISITPSIFDSIAPLQYAYLICLYIMIVFTAGEIPLTLLFLFGIAIDSIHGHILGSSSILLLLTVPYIQLMTRSAMRYSFFRTIFMFALFVPIYLAGHLFIQYIFNQDSISLYRLFMDGIGTIGAFTLIFSIMLIILKRINPNMTTPL